jgi:hypothetical protein
MAVLRVVCSAEMEMCLSLSTKPTKLLGMVVDYTGTWTIGAG